MKEHQVFQSDYLRAEDLGTARPIVTIKTVTLEKIGDDQKPVVMFVGKSKGLVCNKTNWHTIVDITGQQDSDNWPGRKIRLYATKTEYQGKRVPCIRVEEVPADAHTATQPAVEPEPIAPEWTEDDASTPTEDEIPFGG